MSHRPQNTTPLSPMIATFALLTQTASTLPSDASALERSISALESCISALDNKAESLSNSSAGWEPWAWVFTSLVVVGIFVELWVIWDEHSEDMETWAETFFGIQRTLRPSTRRLVVEYLSVVLVAGGIIGELGISIKIASVNSQLRGVDTQLRSKNAELRIESDHLVGLLKDEAERLGKDTEQLQKQNLATAALLVGAQSKIEELRARNLELLQSIAPRDLSLLDPSDHVKFDALKARIDELGKFPGITLNIKVVSDFEARRAAGIIRGLAVQEGWTEGALLSDDNIPDGVTVWVHSPFEQKGNTIVFNNDVRSKNAGEALAKCLRSLGWQAESTVGSTLPTMPLYVPNDSILVEVGFKPSPATDPPWLKETRKKIKGIRDRFDK
jgi:hypothetical protein